MQDSAPRIKWYFRTSTVIIIFLCAGPLALPLVWWNPRYSSKKKLVVTLIVIVLSIYSAIALANSFKIISEYYRQILGVTSF